MTAITLTLAAPSDQQFDAGIKLHQTLFGVPSVVLLMLAAQIGGLVAAGMLAALAEHGFRSAFPVAVAATFGASLAFILHQNRAGRRIRRTLAGSRHRSAPVTANLAPEGLSLHTGPVPWSAVMATPRWNNSTILLFTRANGLPIPDTALPPSLCPAPLAAQIADWKSA